MRQALPTQKKLYRNSCSIIKGGRKETDHHRSNWNHKKMSWQQERLIEKQRENCQRPRRVFFNPYCEEQQWPTPLKDDFQAATNVQLRDYRRKLNIWATTEGYCYLQIFKKKYQHYARLKYGAYPYWGELDLRSEHKTRDFEDLNISICYETENMHVERDFKGINH